VGEQVGLPDTGKIAHTHNNETKSLTFAKSLTFMKCKTQKNNLNLQEI